MKNPDDFLYEYAVVRYVPRVDREEFINIGLLMMCKRQKWLKGRILLNENRILALDPHSSLRFVEEQARVFERTDVPKTDIPIEEKYRWLTAVKSAILQVSPSHPGIIAEAEGEPYNVLKVEFERLFNLLVK